MVLHSRPRLVFSMCLGFRAVRYDGSIIFDDLVEKLKKYVESIAVCPEVGIGLSIPRSPIFLLRSSGGVRLIDTATGRDLTQAMASFATGFLNGLGDVDGFLLKSASPSCGVGDAKVYGDGRKVVGRVDGLFTALLRRAMSLIPIESEKRLLNYFIRRNFYTRIFTLAYVRESLENATSSEDIVYLHRGLKYLIMLYHPGILKELGKLVADRENIGLEKLRRIYRERVMVALSKPISIRSYASVLQHIYGHLKRGLVYSERNYIIAMLNRLIEGREDLRTVLAYFKGFRYRFDDRYLAEQKFLQPYPEELDEPYEA